jgi:hypothetical protein
MKLVMVSVLLLAVGCSDSGSGFAGRYMVVSHTKNATSCDSPGDPVTGGAPFAKFEDKDFFGQTLLSGSGCTSAEDATCEGDVGPSIGFLGPIDGGFGVDTAFNPSGTKEACTFTYDGTRVKHLDGKTVEIREERRMGTRAVKLCDLGSGSDDNLTEEGRTLPCQSVEIVTLTEL